MSALYDELVNIIRSVAGTSVAKASSYGEDIIAGQLSSEEYQLAHHDIGTVLNGGSYSTGERVPVIVDSAGKVWIWAPLSATPVRLAEEELFTFRMILPRLVHPPDEPAGASPTYQLRIATRVRCDTDTDTYLVSTNEVPYPINNWYYWFQPFPVIGHTSMYSQYVITGILGNPQYWSYPVLFDSLSYVSCAIRLDGGYSANFYRVFFSGQTPVLLSSVPIASFTFTGWNQAYSIKTVRLYGKSYSVLLNYSSYGVVLQDACVINSDGDEVSLNVPDIEWGGVTIFASTKYTSSKLAVVTTRPSLTNFNVNYYTESLSLVAQEIIPVPAEMISTYFYRAFSSNEILFSYSLILHPLQLRIVSFNILTLEVNSLVFSDSDFSLSSSYVVNRIHGGMAIVSSNGFIWVFDSKLNYTKYEGNPIVAEHLSSSVIVDYE